MPQLKSCSALLFSFALLGTPLILTGCQTALEGANMPVSANYWQGMQARLAKVSYLDCSGRINFIRTGERLGANYRYQGSSSQNFKLTLTSSLGNLIAEVEVTPEQAYLRTSNKELSDNNAAALFANAFDMQLPLEHFHELVLGIALNKDSQFTPQGILFTNQVQGFTIQYLDYKSYEQLALPSHIEISGQDMQITILNRAVQKLERKEASKEEVKVEAKLEAQAQSSQETKPAETEAQAKQAEAKSAK